MLCSPLLRLFLLALCIAPAFAQGTAAHPPQLCSSLPDKSESLFLQEVPPDTTSAFPSAGVPDGGSTVGAGAALIYTGAPARRLSLNTFFSSDDEHLLTNIGERERQQGGDSGQQAYPLFSPAEAISSPGTQLHTYLPEGQRPPVHIGHENAESVRPGTPPNFDNEATSRAPAPWRSNKAARTSHFSGFLSFMDTATRAAEQTQADGTDRGGLRILAAAEPNDGDSAHRAAVAVSMVSGSAAATPTRAIPRHLQAQKVLVTSDSPGQRIKLGSDSSTSQLSDGISATSGSTSRAFNSEDSNSEPQAGKTRNSIGAPSTSNKAVNGGRDIGTDATLKEAHAAGEYLQGKRQETRLETAAAPSSILQSLLFPEGEEHDTKKAAASLVVKSAPSSVNPQHQRLLAAGIYGASANALRAVDTENRAGGRETGAADFIAGARVALSTLPSLTAAADSSSGWLFFGGKSSSTTAGEQQAPNARTHEAASSLLNGSKQGADTVKDTVSEEKNAVKREPETAQEEVIKRSNPLSNVRWFFTTSEEGQTARKSLDASSFASRFLSQLFAQETEKTASHSLGRAATAPQTRSWWPFGDTSHASATQQQQRLSSGSSSAWWGNPGASTGGSNDVVGRAQKVYEGTREPAEKKSENPSSSLSNLLSFFRMSKEEKKEAAAKAAVKAALSWIADCQQQIQAAVKTLLPASTPQGTPTAAAPATTDNTSATALTSKHSIDTPQRNEPAFFQLEDLLKKLSARQQELSKLTDSEAKSWYSSTQQRVMEQGPTAALASWLYAGSSGDPSTANNASQSYLPRAQHAGTPVVSLPFFSSGLWNSSRDNGSQQQQQQLEAQPAQVKSTSPTLPGWLHRIFTRKAVGDGDVPVRAAGKEPQQQGAVTQAGISSWTEWIVGNRQTSDTQASNLIRKAATATSPGSEGTPWSEKGAALLPLADVAGWLSSNNTSRGTDTAMNISRLGLFGDKPLATEKAAASDPAKASTGLAGAAGDGLLSKVAASLQSAFVATAEREQAASAKEEPIRAPGLPRGAYWWEWQSYGDGETTGGTKAPMYMRHVHLDCDPVLPFQSCVHDCQKESARSLLSSISRKTKTEEAEESGSATDSKGAHAAEPPALDSYEYSTLRSCYLKCKERWLDTNLPGCLRADGVKVEGVPPAAAYRSTTTTTTTVPTTVSYPAAATEAPAPLTDESEGFWSRIRGKKQEQPPSDTTASEESEGTSPFSVFHLRAPAVKTLPPAPEVEQKRSLKNLFGLLQKRVTVPQTAAPTLRESIAKFPQTLWNHLKSGEANAADASGAAGSTSGASSNWGVDSSHLSSTTDGVIAEDTNGAVGTTSWWNLLFNDSQKGNRQPKQVAPIAMEQRIHAGRTTERPEAADNAGEPKLTFSHWCILLVVCMCGALVSICLVSLRRRDILTRLWSVFQNDTNAPAAASLLAWHSLYEQISPKNEQCMQQLSFCSAEGGTHMFEKSEGATQPLIRDERPSL